MKRQDWHACKGNNKNHQLDFESTIYMSEILYV